MAQWESGNINCISLDNRLHVIEGQDRSGRESWTHFNMSSSISVRTPAAEEKDGHS